MFVHVPRTGGSSIWHCLSAAALQKRRLVCDLYHESVKEHGTPAWPNEAIACVMTLQPGASFVIHHHTPQPLQRGSGAHRMLYATILRDPIERFVSDVFHLRRTFRGNLLDARMIEFVCSGWSSPLRRMMRQSPDPDPHELLDTAAADGFFRDYYLSYFSALLDDEPGDGWINWPNRTTDSHALRSLAVRVFRRFEVIADFTDLERAYSMIASAFELRDVAGRLNRHLNPGHTRPAFYEWARLRYEQLFAGDYQLLDEIAAIKNTNAVGSSSR